MIAAAEQVIPTRPTDFEPTHCVSLRPGGDWQADQDIAVNKAPPGPHLVHCRSQLSRAQKIGYRVPAKVECRESCNRLNTGEFPPMVESAPGKVVNVLGLAPLGCFLRFTLSAFPRYLIAGVAQAFCVRRSL